jgi:hypothetical protein
MGQTVLDQSSGHGHQAGDSGTIVAAQGGSSGGHNPIAFPNRLGSRAQWNGV